MAKAKTSAHKVVMTEGKREIIRGLLPEYDIQNREITVVCLGYAPCTSCNSLLLHRKSSVKF